MAKGAATYKYDGRMASKIREGILNGLTLTRIHDSIRHYQQCPSSWQTIAKLYQKDIAEARAELDGKILGAYWKKVKEGDTRLIELGMRSKVGWNPTVNINEMEEGDPDEAVDAVDVLMEKLGKKAKDEDSEES